MLGFGKKKKNVVSMAELCDQIFRYCNEQLSGYAFQDDREWQKASAKACDQLETLTAMAYDVEKVNAVINEVIEKSKTELVAIIKENNKFNENQRKAIEILGRLKTRIPTLRGMKLVSIHDFQGEIRGSMRALRPLLENEAEVQRAMKKVTDDLDALIKVLKKTEE